MKQIEMNITCKFPTVLFGQYEMPTGVKPNDIYIKSPIEWLVLEVNTRDKRALLLSRYALDWEGFANSPILGHGYETSWESSYLRHLLNESFYKNCFDDEERSAIMPIFITPEGICSKRTLDHMFLLSVKEIKRYFTAEESAKTYTPMLEIGSGEKEDPIEICYEPCFWWTRTPGKTPDLVVCVDPDGSLCEVDSNADETGVRPAMWVKL